MERNEQKNRSIAMATSIGVHVAVLLILLFMTAWRAPNPPNPEYGIELNFGLDTQGTGDIQPETPAAEEQQVEQVVEEQKQEPQPEKETAEEKVKEKAVEDQPVSKEESPVVVKETKKEVKEKVEVKKEPVVEQKKEEKVKDEYKPVKPANQGDDKDKVGDKGNPEGKLDANALYGKQGGGAGGTGLELDGWQWDSKPNPILGDSESGRLVFEITVDGDGVIVGIKTLERGLSPEAEKICRKEVEKLTFSPTGKNVPAKSTGKITFVVKAQ